MKKVYIIIPIILYLILLSISVSADTSDDLICFIDAEIDLNDTIGGCTVTAVNVERQAGDWGYGSYYANITTFGGYLEISPTITLTHNWTISVLYKPTGQAGGWVQVFGDPGNEYGGRSADTDEWTTYIDGTAVKYLNGTFMEKTQLWTFRWDNVTMRYSVNGSNEGQNARTTAAADIVKLIGEVYSGSYQTTGLFDNYCIWNRSLSDAEVLEVWTDGCAGTAVVATTSTPVIVVPTPEDNANNNTNVTLVVNHSTANNDVRYYLYFGNTSTLTESHLQLFNSTRTGAEYKNFTTNVSDGIKYYKWKVQNISSGVFSLNTTQRTWTLDSTMPVISFGNNNNFSTDNSTIISSYLSNLTINISFYDINLYQVLIDITNETNNNVTTILNTSITGTTANYSRTIDISSWAVGDYTIKLLATDSHTAEEISSYNVNTGLDYFRYTTEEGNIIKIKSDTFPLTKSTTKFKDRYDFGFNYLLQKDTYKFIIESYNKIDYIEDSDYNAHFVIMGSNGKGNWLDFENPDLNKKDYKVIKITDYVYEIEITANGLKSFTFKSLGGLNLVEEHYKLRIGAVLDVWVFDEENYPVQINATATIGTQSANSTTGVSGARLINITGDTTSLTLISSGFGTEEKAISITQSYHNFSFNMTAVSAAKLYFYDESSNTLIAGETFEVYLETTGFSQTYSGINSSSDNPYTITGLSGGLYELKASSANYLERQYLNLNISNVTTTNLNIYLLNSTDGDEKTFNIVDEALNPLEDVVVNFTRIINGTRTTIAEEKSNFAGQVILYLDSNYEYRIHFSKTNYQDKTINLEPTDSEYVIIMISTVGLYNQSVYEGIRYRFSPINTVLNNNTKYNFTFTLNSSVWDVTNCTLKLFNGTTSLLNNISSFTSNSCYVRIEQDTLSMTNITSEAIYELASTYQFTVTQQYRVIYTYEGEFSLKNFLDDLSDFAMAGFDNFGRMMLALIVIFIITALAAQKVGFTNPEVLILLVIAQVWLFSYVNWLYLDFTPIPTIAGFDLKKYIIAILVSLAGGAFLIEKFSK